MIIVLSYYRRKREREGWYPSWIRYCGWLRERRQRKKARVAKNKAAEERKRLNEKVVRDYNLKPNKPKKEPPHV